MILHVKLQIAEKLFSLLTVQHIVLQQFRLLQLWFIRNTSVISIFDNKMCFKEFQEEQLLLFQTGLFLVDDDH